MQWLACFAIVTAIRTFGHSPAIRLCTVIFRCNRNLFNGNTSLRFIETLFCSHSIFFSRGHSTRSVDAPHRHNISLTNSLDPSLSTLYRYVASGRGRARTVALLLADPRTAADAPTVEGDTALVVRATKD
jgi:hypothetical protein